MQEIQQPEPDGPERPAGVRPKRRRRALIVGVVVVAIVLSAAGAGGYVWWRAKRVGAEISAARNHFEEASTAIQRANDELVPLTSSSPSPEASANGSAQRAEAEATSAIAAIEALERDVARIEEPRPAKAYGEAALHARKAAAALRKGVADYRKLGGIEQAVADVRVSFKEGERLADESVEAGNDHDDATSHDKAVQASAAFQRAIDTARRIQTLHPEGTAGKAIEGLQQLKRRADLLDQLTRMRRGSVTAYNKVVEELNSIGDRAKRPMQVYSVDYEASAEVNADRAEISRELQAARAAAGQASRSPRQ